MFYMAIRVASTSIFLGHLQVTGYLSVSELAYPRPIEEERKVLLYPCEPGFEVRTEELWAMLAALQSNVSGPLSPCAPCDKGASRTARSG